MSESYPFKFLASYDKGDIDRFFGRDKEIQELYQMVHESNITLVYGRSGSGKTSLVDCGLANKIRGGDWLAISIRHNGDINHSATTAIRSVLPAKIIASLSESVPGQDEMSDDQYFETLIKSIRAVHSYYFQEIYLIFDQFEELYVLSDSKEEKQRFYKAVKQILTNCPFCHLIFIMREEFIARLSDFEMIVESLFEKRLRVEPFSHSQSVGVIRSMLWDLDEVSLENENLAEDIASVLTSNERQLELTHLQVVLDALYRKAVDSADNKGVITSEHLASLKGIDNVLKQFLSSQVESIKIKLEEKYEDLPDNAVDRILAMFVSVDETKQPQSMQTLMQGDLPDGFVEDLVDELKHSRILRIRADRDDLLELSHDALAERIAADRSPEDILYKRIVRTLEERTRDTDIGAELSARQITMMAPFEDRLINDPTLTDDHLSLYRTSKAKYEREAKLAASKKARATRLRWGAWLMALILIAAVSIVSRSNFYEKMSDIDRQLASGNTENAQDILNDVRRQNIWCMLGLYNETDSQKEHEIAEMSQQIQRFNEHLALGQSYAEQQTDDTGVEISYLLIAHDCFNDAVSQSSVPTELTDLAIKELDDVGDRLESIYADLRTSQKGLERITILDVTNPPHLIHAQRYESMADDILAALPDLDEKTHE